MGAVTKPFEQAFNFVTKATGVGRASDWKERSRGLADPNRLGYQLDVKRQHGDSAFAADASRGTGAFTGERVNYGDRAQAARARTDATGLERERAAADRIRNRAAELRNELEQGRDQARSSAQLQKSAFDKDKADNIVRIQPVESDWVKKKRLEDKMRKGEVKDKNIFGTTSDLKLPGDQGYGQSQVEDNLESALDRFESPMYKEFLRKIAAAKKGEFS